MNLNWLVVRLRSSFLRLAGFLQLLQRSVSFGARDLAILIEVERLEYALVADFFSSDLSILVLVVFLEQVVHFHAAGCLSLRFVHRSEKAVELVLRKLPVVILIE